MQLKEELQSISAAAGQVKETKYEQLSKRMAKSQKRCKELEAVNENLQIEIGTLISEKKQLEQNVVETKTFVANYEQEIHEHKKKIEKGRRQRQKMKEKLSEMARQCDAEAEEKQYELAQRVLELENKINSMHRNPLFTVNAAKLMTCEEEMRRLQTKIIGLLAEKERIVTRGHGSKPSADTLMLGSYQAQIRELNRKNEKLAYDNMLLSNTQDLSQAQLTEMQKRLDEERMEREQIYQQLIRIRLSPKQELRDENQPNEMV
jgi:chromosome segregation ATPase